MKMDKLDMTSQKHDKDTHPNKENCKKISDISAIRFGIGNILEVKLEIENPLRKMYQHEDSEEKRVLENQQYKNEKEERVHRDEDIDSMSCKEKLWRIAGIILMIIVILFGLLLIYCMPPYYNLYYTFLNWTLPETERGTV